MFTANVCMEPQGISKLPSPLIRTSCVVRTVALPSLQNALSAIGRNVIDAEGLVDKGKLLPRSRGKKYQAGMRFHLQAKSSAVTA
jgi:hypothetical protein